jgi:pSer/pThr/pTyr-binding forkhead associated (FHA) protein
LEANRIGWVGDKTQADKHAHSAQLSSNLSAIRLRIEDRREVELMLNKTIWIGRMDPADDIFPEIDLTDDGPAAKSVSRRHARILKRGEAITIEDLGSVNGTFINRKKLSPYIPEKLHNGDIVQLGTLLMEVKMLK